MQAVSHQMQSSIRRIFTPTFFGHQRWALCTAVWFASLMSMVERVGLTQELLEERTTELQQETEEKRAVNLTTGINDGFLDPNMDPEEYIKRFEVESREVFACRRKILDALELEVGLRVGDIGAGTGLFLKSLSECAGKDGKVYAVEIAPSFIKHLRSRVRSEELLNVEVVYCSDRHANLPKDSVDRLFLCDVYHHFEFPQATLKSLFEALSEGGMLVLVDFHREPKDVSPDRVEWLRGHVRAPQAVFRDEIEKSGFQFKDEISVDGFKENYLLRFLKPRRKDNVDSN